MKNFRQILYYLAIGFSAALLANPAAAQTLYGASTGSPGDIAESSLYTIDPATGAATVVGPTGFDNVTGLACLPDGRMVASANGDYLSQSEDVISILIEIDPASGAGTLIGIIGENSAGSCGRMPDITYDSITGTLFGYGDYCNEDPEGLFAIDPDTGAGTSLGGSSYSGGGNGLAAEPGTGILYATPFDFGSLVIIDPLTGAGTDVTDSAGNVPNRVNALVFHPTSGVLYGSYLAGGGEGGGGVSYLVTINTSNGVTTTVGQTVTGLDALGFACAPAPPPAPPPAPAVPVPTYSITGLAVLILLLSLVAWTMARRRRS